VKERIDGNLSRRAQNIDQSALVIVRLNDDGTEEWLLRRNGHEDLGLGENFGWAKQAVLTWCRAQRMPK
jgi:hypothetical protein